MRKIFDEGVCALLVFVAYCALGYYRLWGFPWAVRDYFKEKRHLGADILKYSRFGVPIGTLMCSVDRGRLPVDVAFATEMASLRQEYAGRLAYFGKFAVFPFLQGKQVGTALLERAVTSWSFDHGVTAVVMMVNPRHVRRYRSFGAREIARTEGTKGMEKAPAVLMVIDYHESRQVSLARTRHLVKQ